MQKKPLLDIHTHTLMSGHAYSTLRENIEEASRVGLKVLGTSEHSSMIPGAPKQIYFVNFKVIPKEIDGVRLYNGIEANIYDENGSIDVEERTVSKVDYIIASLHLPCIKNMGPVNNTKALTGAAKNPAVTVIGHPDDSRFPIDIDELAAAAAEYHTALELNNSSLNPLSSRVDAPENCRKMLEACKKYKTMVIMGTDSHICYDIGRFDRAMALLEETGFPEEQVINFDLDRLGYVLRK